MLCNHKTLTIKPFLTILLIGLYFCISHVAIAEPTEAQSVPAAWSVHGQLTNVTQWHPAFTAPYTGQNSLHPDSDSKETTDLTLFAGMRIADDGELWINPEIDQGFGLSNTLGMAGYPSGGHRPRLGHGARRIADGRSILRA